MQFFFPSKTKPHIAPENQIVVKRWAPAAPKNQNKHESLEEHNQNDYTIAIQNIIGSLNPSN